MVRFEALLDFECAETRSVYVKGMSYRIREEDEALKERVQGWAQKGYIRFRFSETDPLVTGKGE